MLQILGCHSVHCSHPNKNVCQPYSMCFPQVVSMNICSQSLTWNARRLRQLIGMGRPPFIIDLQT